MRSERGQQALAALKGDAMSVVIEAVVRANDDDNESDNHDPKKARGMLHALHDQYADALCVLMYAGRDEYVVGHPYDKADTDAQFWSWWDYLSMDGEHFAREVMWEKWPLGEYLKRGAYMFSLDL